MSANVLLINQTGSKVMFGLWNGPSGDSGLTQEVKAENKSEVTLTHANARIIGVWTDKGDLYPSNEDPFTTGYGFQDGMSYTVILTTKSVTCEEAKSASA